MSNLRKEIDQAIEAATETVTVEVIRNHLGPDAIRQLKSLVRDRPGIGGITIDRLLVNGEVKNGSPKKATNGVRKFGEVDLRDDDVRGRFDAKVLMVISKLAKEDDSGAGMNAIQDEVGGSVWQIRGAIGRLKKARKVKSKGTGRGCRYHTR